MKISNKRKIEILEELLKCVKARKTSKIFKDQGLYYKYTCNLLSNVILKDNFEELEEFIEWYTKEGEKYAKLEKGFNDSFIWFERTAIAPRVRVIEKLIKDLKKGKKKRTKN